MSKCVECLWLNSCEYRNLKIDELMMCDKVRITRKNLGMMERKEEYKLVTIGDYCI